MIATTTIHVYIHVYCNIACQIQPLFEQIIKFEIVMEKSKSLHHGLNVARPVLGS